tara:strand:+ start:101761 stop:102633 length:873 start_codon:yes stop_codon:yes gene_type:complete
MSEQASTAQVTGSYALGLALITGAAVAWSTAGLFTRMIDIDIGTMLFWRGVFGAVGVFAVALALHGRRALRDIAHLGAPGWAFAIISALGMLCFITGLRLTTVAHVAIVYATVPLVAAVLAWVLLAERPARSAFVASLVALAGVVVMVGMGGDGNLMGDLLAFGMTLALAMLMVISRRWQGIPVLSAAAVSALLSGLAALPFTPGLMVSPEDFVMLAAFGLINSALGLALFALGARMLPAVETALITALDAPLAPIWVWLIFAETPSTTTLTGGAVVLTAVMWHLWQQAR